MKSRRQLVFLLVFTLGLLMSLKDIHAETYLKVTGATESETNNATLQCTYVSNATIQDETTLEWTCWIGGVGNLVLRNRFGSIASGTGCPGMNLTGRVSFVGGTGVASILIRDLRMNDAGTYQCKVAIDNDLGGEKALRMGLVVIERTQVFINPKPTSSPTCTFLQASGQVSGVQNVTEVWWTEVNNENFTENKTMLNSNTVKTSVTIHNPTPSHNYTFTLHANHPIAGRPEINGTRTMQCQVTATVQN